MNDATRATEPSRADKEMAERIRGLKRVTIGYSVAYARRNGRMVTIAKGYVADIMKRLNRALVLLPEAERPEVHELSI